MDFNDPFNISSVSKDLSGIRQSIVVVSGGLRSFTGGFRGLEGTPCIFQGDMKTLEGESVVSEGVLMLLFQVPSMGLSDQVRHSASVTLSDFSRRTFIDPQMVPLVLGDAQLVLHGL